MVEVANAISTAPEPALADKLLHIGKGFADARADIRRMECCRGARGTFTPYVCDIGRFFVRCENEEDIVSDLG